jgi:hypothetical protein
MEYIIACEYEEMTFASGHRLMSDPNVIWLTIK